MLRESISATAVRVRAVEETFHRVAVRRVEDSPLVRYLYSNCSYEGGADHHNSDGETGKGARGREGCRVTDGTRSYPSGVLGTDSGLGAGIEGGTEGASTGAGEGEGMRGTSDGGARAGGGMSGRGVLGRPLSLTAMTLLHSRYHSVPKLELIAPLAAKW